MRMLNARCGCRRSTRAARAATVLLVAAGSFPLQAQPAPTTPSASQPSRFVLLVGTDTIATELVTQTSRRIDGELRLRQPRPMSLQYALFLGPDATVDSMQTTTVDAGAPVHGATVIRRDTAVLTTHPSGAEPQVIRVAVSPGTLPFINLSSGVLELVLRRARAIGGATVRVPLLAGLQVVTADVRFIGADSAVLTLGAEIRVALGADGSLLGATVPSQGVRFVRLQGGAPPVDAQAPPPRDYSAPPGAPYTAEEVRVPTPVGHLLVGTLTLPKGASAARPVPVVVTVTGSGPQDRDEYIGLQGYHPFRQLADSLGRRGIGVLRMDDRGTAASGGTFLGATSADFADDVRAGLAYLGTRPEVNVQRLAVMGHSEGALIAPMVADREPSLRAIVLLAGIARPGRGTLHYQIQNIIEHDTSLTGVRRDSAIAAIPARIDSMSARDPWMKFFLEYDPSVTARRVKTPVLIITGATDQQAAPEQVAEQAAAFRESGNDDVTAQVIPGVNHLFVLDPDGFPLGYRNLPPPVRIEPGVVGLIVDWLVARLK